MANEIEVLAKTEVATGVDQFTASLTHYLGELGLPSDRVLVSVAERQRVINNLPDVVGLIEEGRRAGAIYLSKFIAACGAGLFDAALNFIWDETVVNLRHKVARFDLEYFFDSVVTDPNRRSKLNDENDLQKIEEWELIRGCHLTGILSDIGYKHLDYIRDMRNWASAAHPNQNELSGLQLVAWLETCIREVIAKEPEGPVIEVRRFLNSIRNAVLAEADAQHIRAGIEYLPPELATSLLRTLFGMYTGNGAAAQLKANIKLVAQKAWNVAPTDVRYECGLKYATFASNGETDRRDAANEFLAVVGGLPYLPTDTLALEMADKINNLFAAHTGFNNFYNEPAHAKALAAYVSSAGAIPEAVRKSYVKTLVMARIGNGHGISGLAVPDYDKLIGMFGEPELREVANLLIDREFASRVGLRSCTANFRELVTRLLPGTTNQVTHQAFTHILGATDALLPNLGKDSNYKRVLAA
ncbi:hypothetical protein ACSZNY_12615 [Aeromonas caviae]